MSSCLRGLILIGFLALTGCSGWSQIDKYYFPGSPEIPAKARDHLIFLPGCPGPISSDSSRFESLRRGGFDGDIEIFDWTGKYKWFESLGAIEYNRERAQLLADRITELRRANPYKRIHILAVSGGPAIAVWALEKLPPDVNVDRVIMGSPGVAPTFDLSGALRHVKDKCYVFSSHHDVIVSCIMANIWGGMDRIHCDTAGRWGFIMPKNGDAAAYKKLVNMKYKWYYIAYGNGGNHMGASENDFVESVTAPLLFMP